VAMRDLMPWGRPGNNNSVVAQDQSNDPVRSLYREMNRLFDDLFPGYRGPALEQLTRYADFPKLEISEDDKEIQISAELPGVHEDEVEITLENQLLTIRGEKKSSVEEKDKGYSERSYGLFERRITLPAGTEADKASASFENGVLTLKIPRSAEAIETTRHIPINAK